MDAAFFEVKLLGSFGLYRDGVLLRPQSWGIRTTRALLKQLAVHSGAVVSDDALVDRLWPDADVATARRSLRVRVSELRKLFSQAGPEAEYVVERVGEGYRFQPVAGVVEVDADRFVQAARAALRAEEPTVATARTRLARELYGGDLLPGDAYDEGWAGRRERLRNLWCEVSERLADLLIRRGDYDGAVEILESILSPSEPKEEHYRTLMSVHYRAGRQTEALRVFEQCQVALDTLYGARPMPETMRLLETIVGQKPLTEPPGGGVSERPADPAPSPPTIPFLGRTAELRRLREATVGLAAGAGGVFWIAGESGMGKTRLLEQAFPRTASTVDDGRLVFVRGHGPAHAVPFCTLLDGLQEAVQEERMPGGEKFSSELERLLGREDGRPGETPPFGGLEPSAVQGTWLRQRLLHRLRQWAREKPLVLVVDNADEVDDGTWGVLVALSREVDRLPVLIAVASRRDPSEAASGRALAESTKRLHLLGLKPLPLAELTPLFGGAPLTAEARRWLAYIRERSDGEPYVMTELLRWMEQSGMLTRGEDGAFAVPLTAPPTLDLTEPPKLPLAVQVRRRLDARLEALPEKARRVLVQAAVLGDSLSEGRLRNLCGPGEPDFSAALEQLLGAGFLEERPRIGGVGLSFAHARLQNYVYHRTPASHRRRLHGRIARLVDEELRVADGSEDASARRRRSLLAVETAHHAERAGDLELACRRLVTAAEGVASRLGGNQTVALYRHGLAVAQRLPPGNRWLGRVRRGFAKSLFAAYAFAEAIPHLERIVTDGALASADDVENACRLVLAYMQFHRIEDAKRLATRLVQRVAAFDDPGVKGHVLLVVSFVTYRMGEAATAVQRAQSAIKWLEKSDPEDGRLRLARRWLALYHWDLAEYDRAVEHARRAVAACRRHGDHFELTRSLNTLGELYQDLFCIESARALHEEALKLASEGGYALLTSEVWRNIGMNFLYEHKSDKAFHALERAAEHMRQLDASPYWREIALRSLVEAYLLAGDADRVEELLPRYEGVAGPREAPFISVFRGAWALLAGKSANYEELFAQTERFWSQTRRRAREHHVWLFVGRTLVARGAEEPGRAALTRGLAVLRDLRRRLPPPLAKEMAASRPMREVRDVLDALDGAKMDAADWSTA